MDYRDMFEAGNKIQLEQMKKNEHKKGFESIDLELAINKLNEHTIKAILSYQEINHMKLKKDCANVSNFCHMIILKCNEIIGEKNERNN